MEDGIEDEGFEVRAKRKKPFSKDPNPEWFWAEYKEIFMITKFKCENPKWGSRRIADYMNGGMSEKKIKKTLENFFFDSFNGCIYRASKDNVNSHRRAVTKDELTELIKKNHEIDHRRPDAIYETLRRTVFPIVRENIQVLFKTKIQCHQCSSAADLPKTRRTRRPIPATYPNSRWQIDLKKMPPCRGFSYILNVVDCFSRFGFGRALKGKTAKEVAEVLVNFIYLYGAPRIVQSDNGREFKNSDLEAVVKEFDAVQMHGRPYHPQSQGRVERFNRTMTDYFRHKMVDESNWVGQLPQFYYHYNNRVHKSTRPSTPYQLFFKRPNFAAPMDEQVPYIALTKEEKEFLKSAYMDVEQEDEDFESDVEDSSLDSTLIADPELDIQRENTVAARNEYQESRDELGNIACHGEGDGHRNVTHQNQVSLTVIVEDGDHSDERDVRTYHHNGNDSEKGTTDYNWSPMSMPTLSPACMPAISLDENIQEQAQDITEEESPVVTWENIEERNDVDLSQSVSEYYRDIYKRRFSDVGADANEKQVIKRTASESSVNIRQLHSIMYPIEQFAANLQDDIEFYPNDEENVYYRLNPALAAGTSYFNSGFYRPGKCIGIKDTQGGKLYSIKDSRDGTVHQVNRYQIKQA